MAFDLSKLGERERIVTNTSAKTGMTTTDATSTVQVIRTKVVSQGSGLDLKEAKSLMKNVKNVTWRKQMKNLNGQVSARGGYTAVVSGRRFVISDEVAEKIGVAEKEEVESQ